MSRAQSAAISSSPAWYPSRPGVEGAEAVRGGVGSGGRARGGGGARESGRRAVGDGLDQHLRECSSGGGCVSP